MPKSSNGLRQASTGPQQAGVVGQRLARRANGVEDPKRIKLLSDILDESSSIALNDISSQQQGPKQVIENHSRFLDLLEELRQLETNMNPRLPVRDEDSWTKFLDWIDKNSIADVKISDQVGICKKKSSFIDGNDEDEYSLVAKTNLPEGLKIFNIERRLMLTTETASKDLDLYDFIKKDQIASGMQNVVLVLHLLNEYSKRDQSHWWPYLSILPKKILPVLLLNKSTLTRYLLASSHIHEALKLLRSIARQYSYFYQRLHATRLPMRKEFTFEFYAWGVSCVCSRQNEIPLSSSGTSWAPKYPVPHHNAHALIPILDMCNHDPQSNQAIFVENSSCLVAGRDFKVDEEITINYGSQSRSSGEFYIHNGFVPNYTQGSPKDAKVEPAEKGGKEGNTKMVNFEPKVPSTFDVVPISIGLSKNNKLFEQKAKLLKNLNMPTFGRFKLILNTYENRHKRDPHLTMFLIVYSMTEQELELILNEANPVGVADVIYEYVHYKDETNDQFGDMKRRVAKSVEDYLALRASVSIALIDRTLEEAKRTTDEKSKDFYAIRLLQCERRIFESYAKQSN